MKSCYLILFDGSDGGSGHKKSEKRNKTDEKRVLDFGRQRKMNGDDGDHNDLDGNRFCSIVIYSVYPKKQIDYHFPPVKNCEKYMITH